MAKMKDQKTDRKASEPLDQSARDTNPLGLLGDEANCVPLATQTSPVIFPNDEYEDRLKALNNDYEDRLRASNDDYEDRLKASTDEYEDRLKASMDEYEDRLRASADEYEQRLRASTDKYDDKLKASLRATFDEVLPEVREPDPGHELAPTDEEMASADNISSRSSDDSFDTDTPQVSQNGDSTPDTLKCDYLTPIVYVYVGSKKICFLVHRGVLTQSSSLASKCKRINGVETLRLPEVEPQLFVFLVTYLYTRNYQISPSEEDVSGNDAAARFKTHAKVYCLASAFKLDHLVEETIREMERLGRIGFRSLVEVAREVYPNTQANDLWFKNYFKNEVTMALTETPNIAQDQAILDIYKNDGGRLAVDLYTTIITHYANYDFKVDETVAGSRIHPESVANVDRVIRFENRAQDMRSLPQAFRTEEVVVDELHDTTEPLMTFDDSPSLPEAEPVDDMITSKVKKAKKDKKHKETEVSALIALDPIREIPQPEAETSGAGYCDQLATAQHADVDDTLAEVPIMPEAEPVEEMMMNIKRAKTDKKHKKYKKTEVSALIAQDPISAQCVALDDWLTEGSRIPEVEPVEEMMTLNVKKAKKDKKLKKTEVSAPTALDSESAQHADTYGTLAGVPRMPEAEPVEEMMSLNVKKTKRDKKLKKSEVSALTALDSESAQHADTYDTLTGVPRMSEAEPVEGMMSLNVKKAKKDKKHKKTEMPRIPEAEPVEEMITLNVKKGKKERKNKNTEVSALIALDSIPAQHAALDDTLAEVPGMPPNDVVEYSSRLTPTMDLQAIGVSLESQELGFDDGWDESAGKRKGKKQIMSTFARKTFDVPKDEASKPEEQEQTGEDQFCPSIPNQLSRPAGQPEEQTQDRRHDWSFGGCGKNSKTQKKLTFDVPKDEASKPEEQEQTGEDQFCPSTPNQLSRPAGQPEEQTQDRRHDWGFGGSGKNSKTQKKSLSSWDTFDLPQEQACKSEEPDISDGPYVFENLQNKEILLPEEQGEASLDWNRPWGNWSRPKEKSKPKEQEVQDDSPSFWSTWKKENSKPDKSEETRDDTLDIWELSKKIKPMPTEIHILDSWGTRNEEKPKPDEPEQTRDNAWDFWDVSKKKQPMPTEKGDIKETDWWESALKKNKPKSITRHAKRSYKMAEEEPIPQEARPATPPTADLLDQLSPSTLKESSAEVQELSPAPLE